MNQHTFTIQLERTGEQEPIDGGVVTFYGEDYDSFDDNDALPKLLPGGDGPERLDLSLPGFIRWRGILMPASEFKSLRVTLVAKSKA